MMRLLEKEKVAFLLIGDLLAMGLAFSIALVLGHRPPVKLDLFSYYEWGIVTLFLANIIIFFIIDVYSLHKIPERFLHQVLLIGAGLFLSAILVTFIFFFFRNTVPRAVFILFYVISWGLIVLFRYLVGILTLSRIYWKVIIVGGQKECGEIAQLINSRKYLHTRIVGYISDEPDIGNMCGLAHFGPSSSLLSVVTREEPDQVIVATGIVGKELVKDLFDCMKHKVKVADFKKVIEAVSGKIPIDYLSDTWFIKELSDTDKRYFWYAKRSCDIIVSLIGLLLALPFLALMAIMIVIDSRGPIFYSQTRVGRGSRPFRVWKLRTMVSDADKSKVFWTTDNDSRITRIGRYLRKVRFDEVPQLINILKGEMSLIGPRPEAEALVELYTKEIPYYLERHMVTPGITGWAQINYSYGNSVDDTREKLNYDFYYIKNRNMLLDLIIFLRTIRIVMTGKGAL